MHSTPRIPRIFYVALGVASIGATRTDAQGSAQAARASSAAQQSASMTSASTAVGRPITPADMRAFSSVRQSVLSNDGKWFVYVVGSSETDATLVLRGTTNDATETKINVGNGGGAATISGDSKWIGYIVAPPRPVTGRGRGGGAGGGGRAGGGGGGGGAGRGQGTQTDSAQATPPRPSANKLVLMNLATGVKKEFERIRSFRFNAEVPTWIVMQGYNAPPAGAAPAADAAAGRGGAPGGRGGAAGGGGGGGGGGGAPVDLLLYNIQNGEQFNMGNVGDYLFDDAGDLLVYTMSTPDQVGNGIQIRDMKTSVVRALESERVIYRNLAWADSAPTPTLTVLRGRIDDGARDTVFTMEALIGVSPTGVREKKLFDPSKSTDFPAGFKVASERAPRWSDDLSLIFFSIREAPRGNGRGGAAAATGGRGAVQAGAPGAGGTINQTQGRAGGGGGAGELPTLVLWHYKDPRLQSQQIVQEAQDRNVTYQAEYRFAENRVVRLTDDSLRNVTIIPGDKYAYATDNRPYAERASYTGRTFTDFYRVDVATGEKKLIMKQRPGGGGFSASPDGRSLLFFGKDGNYWTFDIVTGDSVNITKGIPTSFVDNEDDHNNIYPVATGSMGWSKDGASVLLTDNWDVWKVPVKPGTGAAVNLTGNGKKDQIRYQRMYNFAPSEAVAGGGRGGRGGGGGGGRGGVDLTKPLFFATYGEWTKKEGLARVDPGQPGAKSLVSENAKINITKARDADVFTYTRQSFTEYPNTWIFNPEFKGGFQVTDANPQMKELAWSSGTRLIDYKSDKGDKLQAAMYLPANYEPGKKYPMIVTIYEKRSQGLNAFVTPSETRAPDPSLYTSRGYVVLDPDIVYKINDPGMSAVWCVIPAVKAAIASGVVDGEHVGLWGHSWGGYQTAFLVTQTDIFKAAIAGAPLTNMVSMYASIYWNTGGSDAAIFESSQGRFKGNFIENYDAYIRNSPVFHADKVKTPLIILQNDKDGAVDFNQGVTYFNTLRQLGKDVIFLEYVGENHGLANPVNQRDYATRMAEFFDYHLKGAPPADWIVNGVPRIKMEEHLRSRADTSSAARTIQPSGGGGGGF